jgi:hypothetical protein
MTKGAFFVAALWFSAVSGGAWAEPVQAPGSDDGMYYAPMDESPGASASTAQAGGSVLSRAQILPFAWGHSLAGLGSVELYMDGSYLGRTPLSLAGRVVNAVGVSLAARADGYEDALRPSVRLPADGPVAVALLPRDAAWPITTPGWVVGLGLVAAGMLVYRSDAPGAGLALAGGGLVSVGLTQLWARWIRLPALRAQVEAFNASPDPAPTP